MRDLRPHLFPAERHTLHWGSHAYHWWRSYDGGSLTLIPGYAPQDPLACPGQPRFPATCVLHSSHATRHQTRITLSDPMTPFGDLPITEGSTVLIPPTIYR